MFLGGGGAGGRGREARVSDFFTKNPNRKSEKKNFFLSSWGAGRGEVGARVGDFFYKESKSKIFLGGFGLGGGLE